MEKSTVSLKDQTRVLDYVMEKTQVLWREQNMDRLLRKFVKILKDEFGVVAASYLRIKKTAGKLSWTQSSNVLKKNKFLSGRNKLLS